ncbi:hypothetical protein [Vibrio jasicida]|uniref:hypothetical protein n=1 Tax=Vibrio jasicida TaxID=766224 RepID=UPI00148BB598|nr:hypothetical protein [Vibrio jasicida]NOJ18307.1 hypothetical protein [Vibrio jasicida]
MHPLQNGSQVVTRPANKPASGLPGYFTESGDNNIPSYPGADWFNHVIDEFLNVLSLQGITFDPSSDENLKNAFKGVYLNSGLEFLNTTSLIATELPLTVGQLVKTYFFNAPVKSTWEIVESGAGDMSDATIALDNGLYAKLKIFNSVVNVLEFGATGVKGEDQTSALQKALTYGQTINADKYFVYYLPSFGDYEATHLSVDRSLISRRIIIAGDLPPSIDKSTTLKLTDTSQSSGFEWDSTMMAYNVIFDFNDARSVGTLAEPRWTLDIRNVDTADDTADLDVKFIDCSMRNFHRAIKLVGRGFLWDGGEILLGGGAANEGCFVDLDFPNPLVPGPTPDQTLVTGMRSYRIQGARVHACTGHLLRNKGNNANNLAQFDFNNLFSDTLMGLVRGAVVNINVNGGTWLSCPATFLRCDSGFDFRNINMNAPNLLGMPEANIGQQMSGGLVTEQDVIDNAQGVIAYVPADAGVVENYNHVGGIISDTYTDSFQFLKAIDGFTVEGIIANNICKENKTTTGTVRRFFNGFDTASKNVRIHGHFKILDGQQTLTEIFHCPNVQGVHLDCSITGNGIDTSLRPSECDYGGGIGSSYCGTYTGDGSPTQREIVISSKRFPKAVMVSERSGSNPDGYTWTAIEGDSTSNAVRLVRDTLIVKGLANTSGSEYSWAAIF